MSFDDNHYDYQQHMIKLQESNVLDGITNEPRVFFDTLPLGLPFVEVNGNPEVFRNGEDFPVRITHLVASMARLGAVVASPGTFAPVDPRLIQKTGLRLKFHDSYYMNQYATNPLTVAAGVQKQVFVPASAWAMAPTAAADVVSFGNSAWALQRPFVLSARDAIRVDVKLDADPDPVTEVAIPVTVSFSGRGIRSGRPYFFSGLLLLADDLRATIDPENFKNDGSEPIMITNVAVSCGGGIANPDPTGDIGRVSVGFRQIGNGTNAAWVQGPVNSPGVVPDLVPAVLLGQMSGRALVHRFPGHGLLWAPGEGLTVQTQSQDLAVQTLVPSVHIGMVGYISVQ